MYSKQSDGCTDHCREGHRLQKWQIIVAALSTAPMAALCALIVGYFTPKPPPIPPEAGVEVADAKPSGVQTTQFDNSAELKDLTDTPTTLDDGNFGDEAPVVDVSLPPAAPSPLFQQKRMQAPNIKMSTVPTTGLVDASYRPPSTVYTLDAGDNFRERPFTSDSKVITTTLLNEPLKITGLVRQPDYMWYQVTLDDHRVTGFTVAYIRTDITTLFLTLPGQTSKNASDVATSAKRYSYLTGLDPNGDN